MDYKSSDFWNRVKTLCKNKKISQTDLCIEINCPVQNLRNKIVRGAYPNIIDCIHIAQFLETSVEYLVTGDKNKLLDSEDILQDKLNRIKEIIEE